MVLKKPEISFLDPFYVPLHVLSLSENVLLLRLYDIHTRHLNENTCSSAHLFMQLSNGHVDVEFGVKLHSPECTSACNYGHHELQLSGHIQVHPFTDHTNLDSIIHATKRALTTLGFWKSISSVLFHNWNTKPSYLISRFWSGLFGEFGDFCLFLWHPVCGSPELLPVFDYV